MKKGYYAIIPANVRYDKGLKANAKLLYGEITALCNEKGYCWASNSYFAELYEVNKETVSRWISQLNEKGYITVELTYKEGTNQIDKRYIRINQGGHDEKVNTPIDEKVKGNTTSFNTTVNNTNNIKDSVHQDELFEEWWDFYNKKLGDKKKCKTRYKSFLNARGKNKVTHEEIMEGTRRYQQHLKDLKARGEFAPTVKYPYTFLNGENFKDEYEEHQSTDQPKKKYESDSVDMGEFLEGVDW